MPTNVKQLVRDGAERVLARAGRARSLDADALAARERVLAVTPSAAHRAARQAHERARATGVAGLALNRAEDFRDAKHKKQG